MKRLNSRAHSVFTVPVAVTEVQAARADVNVVHCPAVGGHVAPSFYQPEPRRLGPVLK